MKNDVNIFDYYQAIKKIKKIEPDLHKNVKKIESFKKYRIDENNIIYSNKNEKYKVCKINNAIHLIKINIFPTSHETILKVAKDEIIIYKKLLSGMISKVYHKDKINFILQGNVNEMFKLFEFKPISFDLSTTIEQMLYSLSINYTAWKVYSIIKDNDLPLSATEENLFYISLILQ